MHEFGGERAELIGQAPDPARLHDVADLPDRRAAMATAAREPAMPAVFFGQQGRDGITFAEWADIQNDPGGFPVQMLMHR